MVIFYPTIEIPILCAGIILWVFCCHFAKKHREAAEGWPPRPTNSPSVYVIPLHEEEEQVEEENEEVMDIYEAYLQRPYRNPPMYFSRNASPPPPYRLEPTSYPDPPPSYTDPPVYSEQRRSSTSSSSST